MASMINLPRALGRADELTMESGKSLRFAMRISSKPYLCAWAKKSWIIVSTLRFYTMPIVLHCLAKKLYAVCIAKINVVSVGFMLSHMYYTTYELKCEG